MPIESKGQRDPVLAARMKAGVLPEEAVQQWAYFVGRRPLKVGEETRQPGDPIPEAADWPRLESWIRSGAVVQRPAGLQPAATPAQPAAPAPQRAPVQNDDEPRRPVLRPRKGASA